jgi:NADH-quinone oxidoreductase subunit L
MAIAVVGGLVGMVAYAKYIKNTVPTEDAEIKNWFKVLYNKYYVDEFYDAIVKPINSCLVFRDTRNRFISFSF